MHTKNETARVRSIADNKTATREERSRNKMAADAKGEMAGEMTREMNEGRWDGGTGAVPVGERVSARDDLRRFTHPCAVQAELLNLRRPLVLGVVRCQAEGATGREQRRLWCVDSTTDGLNCTHNIAHTPARESRALAHHCTAS